MKTPEGYVTMAEIAERAGANIQTVYRWIREGKLKTRKLQNRQLATVEEAERILTPR